MREDRKDPTAPKQPVPEMDPKKVKGKEAAKDPKELTNGGKRGAEDLQDMGHPKQT